MNYILCPKCGKEVKNLMVNVCKTCYIEKYRLAELPEVIEIDICSKCGSVFDRGQWTYTGTIDDVIVKKIEDLLLIHDMADNIELSFESDKHSANNYHIYIRVDASVLNEPVSQSLNTEIRINYKSCDICSRISGGYYEGIIQIRAQNRIPTDDEKEHCMDIMSEVLTNQEKKGDRFSFITDVQELKEGLDVYIGSSKSGRNVCKAIEDELGGSFLESPSLYGQKDGKDLYRITFSMRLPEFTIGDIILFNNKVIEIRSTGKKIRGIDLSTGYRVSINENDIKDATLAAKKADAIPAILIAIEDNVAMVMDPSTYRTITLKKPVFLTASPGNEIDTIRVQDDLFILPD